MQQILQVCFISSLPSHFTDKKGTLRMPQLAVAAAPFSVVMYKVIIKIQMIRLLTHTHLPALKSLHVFHIKLNQMTAAII